MGQFDTLFTAPAVTGFSGNGNVNRLLGTAKSATDFAYLEQSVSGKVSLLGSTISSRATRSGATTCPSRFSRRRSHR